MVHDQPTALDPAPPSPPNAVHRYGASDGVAGGQPWIHIDNSTGTMWLFTTNNCCDPSRGPSHVTIATSADGGFTWAPVGLTNKWRVFVFPMHAAGCERICAAASLRLAVWQSCCVDGGWQQQQQQQQQRGAVVHAAGNHVQPSVAHLPLQQQRRHSMAAAERWRSPSLAAAAPRWHVHAPPLTLQPLFCCKSNALLQVRRAEIRLNQRPADS